MVTQEAQRESNKTGYVHPPSMEDGAVFPGFYEKTVCDSRLHSFAVLFIPSKQFFRLKSSPQLSGTVLSEQEPCVTERRQLPGFHHHGLRELMGSGTRLHIIPSIQGNLYGRHHLTFILLGMCHRKTSTHTNRGW